VVAPFVFITAIIAASLKHPAYSHFKNFISELGATGAPSAAIMNFAGFLPYGILMMAFALGVHRGIRTDAGIGDRDIRQANRYLKKRDVRVRGAFDALDAQLSNNRQAERPETTEPTEAGLVGTELTELPRRDSNPRPGD
jgi:hypothetical protein